MSDVQTGWKHSNTLKMIGPDGSPERANSNETIDGSILAKMEGLSQEKKTSNMKRSMEKGDKNTILITQKHNSSHQTDSPSHRQIIQLAMNPRAKKN